MRPPGAADTERLENSSRQGYPMPAEAEGMTRGVGVYLEALLGGEVGSPLSQRCSAFDRLAVGGREVRDPQVQV